MLSSTADSPMNDNCVAIFSSTTMAITQHQECQPVPLPFNRRVVNFVLPSSNLQLREEFSTESFSSSEYSSTMTSQVESKLRPQLSEIHGLVSEAVSSFQAESKGGAVRVSLNPEKRSAVFNILLNSPRFDWDLMERYIAIEILVDKLAWNLKYSFEYNYIPAPIANIICKEA